MKPVDKLETSSPIWWTLLPLLAGLLYFLAVCLCGASTVKTTAMLLVLLALAGAFLWFAPLRNRYSPPLVALALVVLMDGVSTFYAVSGKFALYEFLKVLSAFCLVLLLLSVAPEREPGRWIAAVLATACAGAGLISIDLLSTRIVSGGFLSLLGGDPDYASLAGVEAGIRMTSLFGNPNVFAGVVGLGVLLSLGLSMSANSGGERCIYLCLLYINALSFLLAFSMGASGAIALAFLVYLLLEQRERRPRLLVLMLETLILTGVSAAVISQTSFQPWDGLDWIPLLCTVLGGAGLCLLDVFLGARAARMLTGKRTIVLTAGVLAGLACFILVGSFWTGGVTLKAGEWLRRAAYPAPGVYSLTVAENTENLPVRVTVESQNQRETMMHTGMVLYEGPLKEAAFTVPDDSLVVYFNFMAEEETRLEAVSCQGEEKTYAIPLAYKLLPSFIANRLQGLFANENAIQRFVFFSDGLKLFRRSPVWGLGMGAFENAVRSVQSFDYETKYAHNHYIQALVETGVIGLILFVALLAVSGASVWLARRQETDNPLVAALGAALLFMALHGAVEVVFSTYPYLPIAFGVFALTGICCGDALPVPKPFPPFGSRGKTAVLLIVCALLGVFEVFLTRNSLARRMTSQDTSLSTLAEAARMDPFEWADYMLSYVNTAVAGDTITEEVLVQADQFAERLARVDSNSIPIHLAEYFFRTGRVGNAFAMLQKYVSYVSSSAAAWQSAFDLMERYEVDSGEFRAGVVEIGRMLTQWNEENMGAVTIDEEAMAFLGRMEEG